MLSLSSTAYHLSVIPCFLGSRGASDTFKICSGCLLSFLDSARHARFPILTSFLGANKPIVRLVRLWKLNAGCLYYEPRRLS
jgi:hypothetical protein